MTELEGGEEMIADRLDLQRVEHAVARILAEQDHPLDAYGAVLQTLGSSLEWELGSVWEVDPDDGWLRCVRTWHSGGGARELREFEAMSERLVLAPGEGLPGRVVSSGEPAWKPRTTATSRAPTPPGGAGSMQPSPSPCAARAASSG
jgi:hypothetical protein